MPIADADFARLIAGPKSHRRGPAGRAVRAPARGAVTPHHAGGRDDRRDDRRGGDAVGVAAASAARPRDPLGSDDRGDVSAAVALSER